MFPDEFQLNEFRHVDAVNVDIYKTIELESKTKQLTELDLNNTLDVNELFDTERQASNNFRIYGTIEYFSQLNGIKKSYSGVTDYFSTNTLVDQSLKKIIFNSFNIYLVKPKEIINIENDNYLLNFEIMTSPQQIEIKNSGFYKNIFNEQNYNFNFTKDLITTGTTDPFGKPLSEVYLFFDYIPDITNPLSAETKQRLIFETDNTSSKITVTATTEYSSGNTIYGNLIEYKQTDFLETTISAQTYYITTYYDSSGDSKQIQFKYNPFYKIKLREYSTSVNIEISGNSRQIDIPFYAKSINSGETYIWQDLLDFGYVEPDNNVGVDFPFVNNYHYVYNNILFNVVPDLEHVNTLDVYNEIKLSGNTVLNLLPFYNVDSLGSVC